MARRTWRRLLLSVCMAAAAAAVPTTAQAAQIEAPSHSLQVWNLNTHLMQTHTVGGNGNTNYRYFLDYITNPARVAYYPDILTLQETGTSELGLPGCGDVVAYLEWRTGGDYSCVQTTAVGGAAIVYNVNRLSRQTNGAAVRVFEIDTAGSCKMGNWYASTLRLRDDVNTSKYVNVGSVHLPNLNYPRDDASGWATDCAWNNMKTVSPSITYMGSASMQIMAGDWNHTDAYATNSNFTFQSWECWYAAVNTPDLGGCLGDLWGWKDAMYRQCVTSSASATYTCLRDNHWTFGTARIDFLFVKAYAVHNQITVKHIDAYTAAGSPPGAPAQYSDHRGQGALVKYYN